MCKGPFKLSISNARAPEAWNNIPPPSINIVAYVWSVRRVWFGKGSDSPKHVHIINSSVPSSKNMSPQELLHRASSLLPTNTQGTDVAISVAHCDYMLTDHLHGYRYLCRSIDEIWMCWAFFSPFLFRGTPSWNLRLCFHFVTFHGSDEHLFG